ncbi:glycosyltransferase [Angustibacter luteus]|uniref:Glycosyltransferase family 2 protein n=1 Tax=Angustibacter luteus TaxID=658456 RepID=A0ABW1JGH7_9ACTN
MTWDFSDALFILLIALGSIPALASVLQYVLAGPHALRDHLDRTAAYLPRVAILVPAWNEGAVLGPAVRRLLDMDYPDERIRVVVIDDASTDNTPELVGALAREHPGRVVHLRREQGGQGKAHTLNAGLELVLGDDWAQAVLIMDADVVFETSALRRMTRHLVDPSVGAVTAYIREGSVPGNWLNRFIAIEYAAAQAVGRRAQNVLGAMACLAGGAQLHDRASLERIGGRIDTSTLAEDTVTTMETQLAGARVVFDPHAIVLAEEPAGVNALWRQRLRWARGNLQVTGRYRHNWFRRRSAGPLGGWIFGIIWFALLFEPVIALVCSVGLVTLLVTDADVAWRTFQSLWLLSFVSVALIVAVTSFADTDTAKRAGAEAVLFPGIGNLFILAVVFSPWLAQQVEPARLLFYAWPALAMLVVWLARLVDRPRWRWLSALLVLVGGYGSLLSAVNVNAYVAQARHQPTTWAKTEKKGMVQG